MVELSMSSQFILPFPVVSSGDARNPFKGVNFLQAREGPVRRPENIYSIEVMETSTIGTGMKYSIEVMETSTIGESPVRRREYVQHRSYGNFDDRDFKRPRLKPFNGVYFLQGREDPVSRQE